jgi:methyl-accepting chemotaxis protein
MFALSRKARVEPQPAADCIRDQLPVLNAMLDQMPINVLVADPQSCDIIYANAASRATLHTIRHLLPGSVDPDNMDGVNIDIFHKNPQHQRKILADPSNLPWNAKIKLGPETLALKVGALTRRAGQLHRRDGHLVGDDRTHQCHRRV